MANCMAATMKIANTFASISSIFIIPINKVSNIELMTIPTIAMEAKDMKRFSFLSVTLNVK